MVRGPKVVTATCTVTMVYICMTGILDRRYLGAVQRPFSACEVEDPRTALGLWDPSDLFAAIPLWKPIQIPRASLSRSQAPNHHKSSSKANPKPLTLTPNMAPSTRVGGSSKSAKLALVGRACCPAKKIGVASTNRGPMESQLLGFLRVGKRKPKGNHFLFDLVKRKSSFDLAEGLLFVQVT